MICNTITYKFTLDNAIPDNGWKKYISKAVDIFVVAKTEDGLYEFTDVYVTFEDLLYLPFYRCH